MCYKDHTLVPVMDNQGELLHLDMSSANPAGLRQSPYIPGRTLLPYYADKTTKHLSSLHMMTSGTCNKRQLEDAAEESENKVCRPGGNTRITPRTTESTNGKITAEETGSGQHKQETQHGLAKGKGFAHGHGWLIARMWPLNTAFA